jgi:hypothetical protein
VYRISSNPEANVRRGLLTAVLFLAACCVSRITRADNGARPGITFFRSDITVRENATLEVREEFAVRFLLVKRYADPFVGRVL